MDAPAPWVSPKTCHAADPPGRPASQPRREEPCTLAICDDCLFLLVNGECIHDTDDLGPAGTCPTATAMTRRWGTTLITLGALNRTEQKESDDWFSTSPCDGCGSPLGGTRHHATAWVAADPPPPAPRRRHRR